MNKSQKNTVVLFTLQTTLFWDVINKILKCTMISIHIGTNYGKWSTLTVGDFRAPDKRGIEDNSKIIFSYFSKKTYVVTPH